MFNLFLCVPRSALTGKRRVFVLFMSVREELETVLVQHSNGACAHYVMVSKIQWKPFWLATQLYPQKDWIGWQNGVNYDVCTQARLQKRSDKAQSAYATERSMAEERTF